jgi:hypothetical protein
MPSCSIPRSPANINGRALPALVGHAVQHAQAAGCEWLHVDFEPHLVTFYLDACGFQSTPAGVIHLPTHGHDRKPAD